MLSDRQLLVGAAIAVIVLTTLFSWAIIAADRNARAFDEACIAKGGVPYHGYKSGYLCLAKGVVL